MRTISYLWMTESTFIWCMQFLDKFKKVQCNIQLTFYKKKKKIDEIKENLGEDTFKTQY